MRIKRLAISALLISLLLGFTESSAQAARAGHSRSPETSGTFGLGAVIGEPTGITGKYWFDQRSAVDTTLSYSFNHYFTLNADYLYHFPMAFGRSSEFASHLIPYVGVGGELFIQTEDTGSSDRGYFNSSDGSAGFGIRLPLGIEWRPATTRLGVFAEVVPGVGVVPSTFGFVQGGVGARFYF